MKVFRSHIDKNIWWLAGIWADHERLYTKKEVATILRKERFRIEELREIIHWSWPFAHFLLYGIGKNLVERLGMTEFSRFNSKPRPVARTVSRIFRFPSDLLDKRLPLKTAMDIVLSAVKDERYS